MYQDRWTSDDPCLRHTTLASGRGVPKQPHMCTAHNEIRIFAAISSLFSPYSRHTVHIRAFPCAPVDQSENRFLQGCQRQVSPLYVGGESVPHPYAMIGVAEEALVGSRGLWVVVVNELGAALAQW